MWIFTGDSVNNSGTVTSGGRTVTNTRDIFYPVGTGSNDYHHIYPIAIAADGTIYSNVNSGKSGWNFSNGSNAQVQLDILVMAVCLVMMEFGHL